MFLIFLYFAAFGCEEGENACKMMPQGVRTLSTPSKPKSDTIILDMFRTDIPNIRPTFVLHVPTNLPWQLTQNNPSHVVDGSTCLQLGHDGFLPSSIRTPETGNSTPVGTPRQNPNSVGTLCPSSRSPNTGTGGQ